MSLNLDLQIGSVNITSNKNRQTAFTLIDKETLFSKLDGRRKLTEVRISKRTEIWNNGERRKTKFHVALVDEYIDEQTPPKKHFTTNSFAEAVEVYRSYKHLAERKVKNRRNK